ncbi:PREDICTED: uncharacterized protein LOC109166929 [Ipomoea nil]|uniref:uncharacterized protein LOC109166929 n=1 Tax=Ipomoea nil TaxID=35883 RepID=UPI000900D6DD|nr:PREDICTED: uncharacterized protein LOC109166929 [Ipomoea nil]
MRRAIQNFKKFATESWERFKEMRKKSPHHGIQSRDLMMVFYGGFLDHSRVLVDASSGGSITFLEPNQAEELLEKIAMNGSTWYSERSSQKPIRGIHEVEKILALSAKVDNVASMVQKLAQITLQKQNASYNNNPFNLKGPIIQIPQETTQVFHGEIQWGAANPQHFVNRGPPGFQGQQFQGMQSQPRPPLPTLEAPPQPDLGAMMNILLKSQLKSEKRLKQVTERLDRLSAHNKMLENQLANQASTSSTKDTGKFPACTENPIEQVNAIVTRSGKIVDVEIEENLEEEEAGQDSLKSNQQVMISLKVSIPLLDLLSQVPSYGKFLRDILTKKRKFGDHEMIDMAQEYRALSRASVNVMPLSLCQKLKLGNPQPVNLTLTFADQSTTSLNGILEDVPVRVDKYFVPCDFIVIAGQENPNTPIILGRPFLATTGAIIDARKGSMIFDFGEEEVEFDVLDESKSQKVENCSRLNASPWCMLILVL